VYPALVRAGLRPLLRRLLIPSTYLPAVRGLDHVSSALRDAAPRTLYTPACSRA